jgi:hypothetical protein
MTIIDNCQLYVITIPFLNLYIFLYSCHTTTLEESAPAFIIGIMDATAELAQINEAISHILQGGQSYSLNTGGGSRTVTYADYNALVQRKKALETQLAIGSGSIGGRIGAAW